VAADAVSTLVNLTRDPLIIDRLSSDKLIADIYRIVVNPESILADLGSMLLSNLTITDFNVKRLLQLDDPKFQGTRLFKLIDIFSQGRQYNPKADFFYLALVFANVTRLPEGRECLLNKDRFGFQKLFPFINHPKLIVRGGIASTLKNCCFQVNKHEWLMSNEVDIISVLLSPLAKKSDLREEEKPKAPKFLLDLEPEKTREPDLKIRITLTHTILLLTSSTYQLRNYLRDNCVYPVMREMNLEDSTGEIDEAIHGVVNMLLRDESPETPSNSNNNSSNNNNDNDGIEIIS